MRTLVLMPENARTPDDPTFAIHVRLSTSGTWWTVDLHGEILSQWPSEFAAIDAGRVNARRFSLPLVIHDAYRSRVEQPPDED